MTNACAVDVIFDTVKNRTAALTSGEAIAVRCECRQTEQWVFEDVSAWSWSCACAVDVKLAQNNKRLNKN